MFITPGMATFPKVSSNSVPNIPPTKLFAEDTSLFSVVKNVDATNIDLNNDLKKIGKWTF